jgi:hypothetical protein
VSCDVRTRENLGGKDSLYREGLVVLRRDVEGLDQVRVEKKKEKARWRRGSRIGRGGGDVGVPRMTPRL